MAAAIPKLRRYAQVLLVLLPLAALRFRRERSRTLRWLALASAALICGGMMLTFSRGAMLTAVIIFGLLAYFRFIRPLHVVAVAFCLGLLVLVLDPQAVLRFASLEGAKNLLSGHTTTFSYNQPTQGKTAVFTGAALTVTAGDQVRPWSVERV